MDMEQRRNARQKRYPAELMNIIYESVLDQIEEGVTISDAENKVIFVNRAAEAINGVDAERSLGRRIEDLYAPTPNTPRNSHYSVVLRTGIPADERYNQYVVKESHKTITAIEQIFPVNVGKETVAAYSLVKNLPVINRSIEQSLELYSHFEEEKPKNGTRYTFDSILGKDARFLKALSNAKNAAKGQANVLLYGETGTGKELFAQSIHNNSPYQNGPFISVNCAAIPATLLESMFFGTVKGSYTGAVNAPGLFEQAKNGTIFLDEINSMDMGLQAKILKVIENKTVRRICSDKETPVMCRILCALNEDPVGCIHQGKLRKDLYYRLASCILYIPPLRERKSDIPLLVDHFVRKFNQRYAQCVRGIDDRLMGYLLRYPWPGNIRELQHMLESAYSIAESDIDVLKLEALPAYHKKLLLEDKKYCENEIPGMDAPLIKAHLQVGASLKSCMESYEWELIKHILEETDGNITAAAEKLQITRQALQHKIKKYRPYTQ